MGIQCCVACVAVVDFNDNIISVTRDLWLFMQDTAGEVCWANDNKMLFYVTKNKVDRPFKVGLGALPSSPGKTAYFFYL